MSVLSYKSQTFNDIKNEFISNPNISKEEQLNILIILNQQ